MYKNMRQEGVPASNLRLTVCTLAAIMPVCST